MLQNGIFFIFMLYFLVTLKYLRYICSTKQNQTDTTMKKMIKAFASKQSQKAGDFYWWFANIYNATTARENQMSSSMMYQMYFDYVSVAIENFKKCERFENFLITNGANVSQSNVSESRYYRWQGYTWRFSSHVYPTGSMTDDILCKIDLAADVRFLNQIEEDENGNFNIINNTIKF